MRANFRMLKKAVQQGRSERRGEAYFVPYVEPLSEARTPLADFFSILLVVGGENVHRTADNRAVCGHSMGHGRFFRFCTVIG